MQGPQWHSKTIIIAERGWHLPQCRYAKSFSKVHAAPQWFSTTTTTIIAERCWYFHPGRYAISFSKVYARCSMTFKTISLIIAESDCHLPQCRYAKSFSKVHAAPQWFSKTMIIAERSWYCPSCSYAKSFSRVYARHFMTFKNNDYSWEGLIFSSMPLCEIVFKSICEALNDIQKQWL